MTTQEECDYADKLAAARAMLAALELVKSDPSGKMLSSATWNDVKTAIAQAEAAGLKGTS